MATLDQSAALLFATLTAVLGVGLVAVLAAALRGRRAARRLTEGLADLRRHALVGSPPTTDEPILAPATREIGALVEELRAHVRRLQARASTLQALADGPTDVALIGLQSEWQVGTFSRGASTITGWPPEEIVGQHVEALFAPGEWERLLPKLARRTVREEGFSDNARLMRRDGAELPCRISVGPAGVEGGTLLVARDLRSEEDLERRLRMSEERHRRLVEEVRDGVFLLQGGRIAYANPALAGCLGLEADALRGRAFKEFIDSRDLLRVLDLLGRAERGEEAWGETTCRLAAPGRAPLDARVTWAATEVQGRRALFGTVADLTERSRVARAVAESEARLRSTFEAAGDGLALLTETESGLVVSLANAALGRLAGAEPSGLAGLGGETLLARLAGGGDSGSLRTLLDEARAGTVARRDAFAAGGDRLIELAAAPVAGRGGDRMGVIVTARDVTARVTHERALARSVQELTAAKQELERSLRDLGDARQSLQERNAQLERLNTELRSLDEMKSNLLANVSHELHTPLVSIKGYTEMILKRKLGPLTPEQQRGLEVALKNIDRLIELIDNLLSFARLETGETQLTIEDVPLWQLVDEAVELVGERIRRRNLSVTTQYESDGLMVRGDRVKLGQVLINLLTNAVKFNRDGGTISVAARHGAGGFLEVEVADTGIGIAPEEQEKIFERFYQVESGSKRRYEGTGIGLAIVRDILRLHGCTIRVESRPDEGTRFVFTLPLGRRPAAGDARPQSAGRHNARG